MKAQIEWLTERADHAPTSYTLGLSPLAALKLRMAWQKLRFQAQEGDELWAFVSPPRGWRKRGEAFGYALVREGQVVRTELVGSD